MLVNLTAISIFIFIFLKLAAVHPAENSSSASSAPPLKEIQNADLSLDLYTVSRRGGGLKFLLRHCKRKQIEAA